jgi:ABC-type proline/glycine betaine transport system permease subunit
VPAAQSAHGIVEFGLYLPTAHRVHVVALGDASVLVTLPALHVMQVALPAIGWYVPAAQSAHGIVEFGLYLPTAHRVHVVALGDASVLVTLPALHVMQVALPAIG